MSKKLKKIIGLLLFIGLLISLFFPISSVTASAQSSEDAQSLLNENIQKQLTELDLSELQEYVDSLKGYEGGNIAEHLWAYVNGEGVDYGGFFSQMAEMFFSRMIGLFPAFSCIAAITLLCGILSSLNSQFAEKTTGQTVFFVAYASALIPILSIVTECFSCTQETIESLKVQMQTVFPLLLTLMAAGGGTVSAAIFKPAVAFLSNSIVSLISTIVLPITLTIIAFSLAGHLTKTIKIDKFTAFFKSINKLILGVSLSVFALFFSVQGITSASFDGVAKKVTQYAIGTGVPIVGGFLSGGFDLAVAGSILIKNSLGSMSIFLLIGVLLEPLILLISVNVLLRLTAAVTQPFGDERISNFLTEISDNLNFCSASVVVTAFFYFICILLFFCYAGVFV